MKQIKLCAPDLQIGFAKALEGIRASYLQDALSTVIARMQIDEVDNELHMYASKEALSLLAVHGMRGELLFAVPCILKENPQLLGYYRLLLGYSQKAFYAGKTGAGMFKSMEEKGHLSHKQECVLPDLCKELNTNAEYMLNHFEAELISAAFFDQLTLLTLGSQLRGKSNVDTGTKAIAQVFDIILKIVEPSVVHKTDKRIELKNRADRRVSIQFSSDPDIFICEELAPDLWKKSVAIEIKGGTDYANIHNRIGEAEKSHQKAKKDGYVECWTVVNVEKLDMEKAKKESPTTNRFYHLSELENSASNECRDFSLQISSIIGI